MKKHLLFLFTALLPLVASAQTKVEIDGIWYNLITKAKLAEVTYKGDNPYYDNDYSDSITIPATVTYNGVAYSVTSIGHSAFYECSSLTAITIPESVKSIGSNAFNNCMNLTSATIPMNSILTSIGDQAFERCSSLTSITIPATVTFIGGFAFSGCNGLTSVHISDLEAWCNIEFYDDSFFVGNCNPLIFAKNLYLNGTLVTHLTIPSTVTHIKDYTFNGCNLTSVTIHKNVTSIGKHAFLGCTGELMVECNIPMALEDEVFGSKYGAFDGSGFSKITIGTGVTSIGSYAFSGCSKLTDIYIPEGVTSIEEGVFQGCSSLTSITIPKGVTSIGNSAFSCCNGLTAITIPEGVTSIGEGALFGCGTLTSIVLPKSIKYINSEAFANCLELTDVYCYADTVPSAGADVFRGSYIEYATLHVPASAMNSYKATAPWSSFGTIVCLTDEDMSIEQLTNDNSQQTIYDLCGRRVTDIEKGGIYIVGGKKVIIK